MCRIQNFGRHVTCNMACRIDRNGTVCLTFQWSCRLYRVCVNLLRPYDESPTTMRRTNGIPRRAGYLLTVWFNELGFTCLGGNAAILEIPMSPWWWLMIRRTVGSSPLSYTFFQRCVRRERYRSLLRTYHKW